jgi:hypothetical protein
MAGELRIFERDGSHLRTIGRQGSGPGEFERIGVVLAGPGGRIWADDARLRRWEVFDTAGVRVAGYPGNSNVGGGIRAWTGDGRLLEVNSHAIPGGEWFQRRNNFAIRRITPNGVLVPMDSAPIPVLPEGESVNFLRENGRPAIRSRLPLAHHPRSVLGPDGDFWVSDGSGAYTIRRQRLEGDTVLIVERSYEPIPTSPDALRLAAEELVPPEGMSSTDNDPGRIPTVQPPFNDFFPATDSILWVRRTIDGDSVVFDVFDPAGRYLGVPASSVPVGDLRIRLITRDWMYAVVEDELEVESVLLLRIERP